MSKKIVCMLRGGGTSWTLQEKGISLALEMQAPLVFLHVVTQPTAVAANQALMQVANREVAWVGQVVLKLAQKSALARGVQAETVLRVAGIVEAVTGFLRENEVEVVLLGEPRPDSEDYERRCERVRQLAQEITQSTGISVQIVKEFC